MEKKDHFQSLQSYDFSGRNLSTCEIILTAIFLFLLYLFPFLRISTLVLVFGPSALDDGFPAFQESY